MEKAFLYSRNELCVTYSFMKQSEIIIQNPKNHISAFWRLLKLVFFAFKTLQWALQSGKKRCSYSDLYGIFHLNSWTLYVYSIAMWHTVQSDAVLEVLKTGCSLTDYIEHVTNLKYEKERNLVVKSMKPESTSFSITF